jgi:kinesin family protein C2/C3
MWRLVANTWDIFAADMFKDTTPVVESALDGYNICIFAYEYTKIGKTFTIEGIVAKRGVNYQILEELFKIAAQLEGQINYNIFVGVMEVYNEQIHNLLPSLQPKIRPPKK